MSLVLAQDETIQRLLLVDSPDALTCEFTPKNPNELITGHYVSFYPPVENRIEEYDRNTFISIVLNTVTGADVQVGNYLVYVSTDQNHIALDGNKDRLLELVDRIYQILDGCKLTAAGETDVTTAMFQMLSEMHPAYKVSVHLRDQQNLPKGDL